MPRPKSLEEIYDSCIADNLIQDILSAEPQKASDLVENADIYRDGAEGRARRLDKHDKKWMLVYIDFYEAMRLYAEALAHLAKRRITNHQCLFAFICTGFPELELDFNFFEKIRTKRNGVNYYGQRLSYDDWKQVELQMKLYAASLKKAAENRIAKNQQP